MVKRSILIVPANFGNHIIIGISKSLSDTKCILVAVALRIAVNIRREKHTVMNSGKSGNHFTRWNINHLYQFSTIHILHQSHLFGFTFNVAHHIPCHNI